MKKKIHVDLESVLLKVSGTRISASVGQTIQIEQYCPVEAHAGFEVETCEPLEGEEFALLCRYVQATARVNFENLINEQIDAGVEVLAEYHQRGK